MLSLLYVSAISCFEFTSQHYTVEGEWWPGTAVSVSLTRVDMLLVASALLVKLTQDLQCSLVWPVRLC